MNKSKIILACFLFYVGVFVINAQTPEDLYKNISKVTGTKKVDLFLKIGNVLCDKYGMPDSLLYYANKAYTEAANLNYEVGQQKAIFNIAIAYQKKDQYDTSIVILNKLLTALKESMDDNFLADINFNLGLNYRISNRFKEASEYYISSIKYYQKSNNFNGITLSNVKLAGIFTLQKQFDLALLYGRKAHSSLKKVKDPLTKVTTLSALSGIYTQVATTDSLMIDSLMYFAKEALRLVNQYEYFTKGNQLCLSISSGYLMKHDLKNALFYCNESMKYRNYLYEFEIINSYLSFSDCYFEMKNYKSSVQYLDSAQLVLSGLKDPFYQMRVYERYAACYDKLGDVASYQKANTQFVLLKDSLFRPEKTSGANEVEREYSNNESKKILDNLNDENLKSSKTIKYLAIAIAIAALLIAVVIILYRQSTLKSKLAIVEAEQRLNRARMDPHFFFNSLASLQSLSMDENKNKEITQYIHRFSKIMRESLESTYKELNTIENEIEFLTHYLELQKLRCDNKFNYEVLMDEKLETSDVVIPGMILQPFIENSIEHGFASLKEGGIIKVEFKLEEKEVVITITDNGLPLEKSENHKGYPSRATQIITDRLFLLNKKYKTNAIFVLSKMSANAGTKVEIRLPLIYKT